MEIWKDIAGYEGLYQVSNYGRVKNVKRNKIKSTSNNGNGYLRVFLWNKNKQETLLVHRLVAEAFIPNQLNLPQINHKDEEKTNNKVENLEWCDCKYNINYGAHNKRVSDAQINNPNISKTVLQFSKSGEFIREWPSAHEIRRQLGYSRGCISDCCRGNTKSKSAYGYIWKYKKEVV